MEELHILEHPLLQHKLAIIRSKDTGVRDFRQIVSEIAKLMCFEATRDLPTEETAIETPMGPAVARTISGKKLALVPILRAGLGMVDGILTLIPSAKIGHIGMYRDPATVRPVEYYCKMPPDIQEREVFLLDPLLATGGSAEAAIAILEERYGCRNIKLLSIIGVPQGIEFIRERHPNVKIFVAALDPELNDHSYIIPGLGDAGDRIFGTI